MSVIVTIYNQAANLYLATDSKTVQLIGVPFKWSLEGYTTPGKGKEVDSTIAADSSDKAIIDADLSLLKSSGSAPVVVDKTGLPFTFGAVAIDGLVPISVQATGQQNPAFLTVQGNDVVVSFTTGADGGAWLVAKV